MPPKARITRDMILDAAFEIARESGIDSVNARTISQRLHCSTQPVLYYFKTIDEIRRETFKRADAYHTAYIIGDPQDVTMMRIGEAYVRFAATEKHLFRLLFQSDHFAQQDLVGLIEDESIAPIINMIVSEDGLTPEQAKASFMARFMLVHGMASLLANNSMSYDEGIVSRVFENAFLDEFKEEE